MNNIKFVIATLIFILLIFSCGKSGNNENKDETIKSSNNTVSIDEDYKLIFLKFTKTGAEFNTLWAGLYSKDFSKNLSIAKDYRKRLESLHPIGEKTKLTCAFFKQYIKIDNESEMKQKIEDYGGADCIININLQNNEVIKNDCK